MQTKISVFITATVLLLLLGVTNTIAQGSKIYFKKNDVTVFQSEISDIDSIKFAVENNKVVTGVTVTPETSEIPKGYALEFAASVYGDNLTESEKAVTWTVTGGTSKETAISTDGILSVSATETSENLTITATSTIDNSKKGTAIITIFEYQNIYEDCTKGAKIVELDYMGEKISCFYVDGKYIVSGDIVIKDDTKEVNNVSLRAAMNNKDQYGFDINLWDEGKVYYFIGDGASTTYDFNLDIYSAMQKIESVTNIKFIQLKTIQAREYKKNMRIRIVPDVRNASYVGLKKINYYQDLWLNASTPSTIHEICHALGLMHENQRPDAEKYIDILWVNIEAKQVKANFALFPDMKFYSGFDFESIMMYSSYAFSWNELPTLLRKDNKKTFKQQRERLTPSDIQVLNQMYPNRNASPDVFIHDDFINQSSTSVELTGELIYEGYPAVTEYGICYREYNTGELSWKFEKGVNKTGDGTYTCTLGDLKPGKEYEVRAYVIQEQLFQSENSVRFTTKSPNIYTITAFASTGGKIDPSGDVQVEEGKDQTFSFTPDDGYEIAYVLIDEHNNPSAVAAGEYTFPSVTSNHTITVTFKEIVVTPTPELSVSQTWMNFSASGKQQTFTITSNTDWTISSNALWLTISPTSGSNDETITVTADTNTNTNQRTATITVSGTDVETLTISVTQDAAQNSGNEQGVEINGIIWATRNVGAPGTFVQKPENYGEYYQWNKGTLDYIEGWNGNGASSWLPENDPSPAGWRVPTLEEAKKLTDVSRVNIEWTIQNGVNGTKFTDKTNGNSIFLPATGEKDFNSSPIGIGRYGIYWLSAVNGPYAYFLDISSSGCYFNSVSPAGSSNTLRSVVSGTPQPELAATIDNTAPLPASGGTREITITSNIAWTVTSDASWLTVPAGVSPGNGNKTFTITIPANTSTSDRSANLTITGSGITRTINIVQDKAVSTSSDWVLINGVKWATRNVGVPGTFVQNPEDYGEYYQWNKGTTNFLINGDYDNCGYPNSTIWLPTNDPSPAGYRVPTMAEIQSLTNTNYVTYEWITQNGVTGGKFTDKTNRNSIFLPASGYRYFYDGSLASVGVEGIYWSSTQSDVIDVDAYRLGFWEGNAYLYDSGYHFDGNSIRPIAK